MSKRPSSASTSPPKRSKKTHVFGGPSPADEDVSLLSQLSAPSSTSLSTRYLAPDHVPALTTLCARSFVANVTFLFRHHREETQEWLKALPDTIISPLFAMLRRRHDPSLWSHPFITTFFLRGQQVALSSALPGVSSATVLAISKMGTSLRDLRLVGLSDVPDDVFSKLLSSLTNLEILVLRECTKVGRKAVRAIRMSQESLKVLNLNHTSAPVAAISFLTGECLELQVLKLAGIPGITDATLPQIFHVTVQADPKPLTKLQSLKLRHTAISDLSLKLIITLCPHLSSLDVSFTCVKHPIYLFKRETPPKFSKLSLTSTPLKPYLLKAFLEYRPCHSIFHTLRVLHLGALGSSPLSNVNTSDAALLILNDDTLNSLTNILVECKFLEDISLVGNTKLGLGLSKKSSLKDFLRKVGRRCKVLNLAGIPRLKSSDLTGLLPLREQQDMDALDSPAGQNAFDEESSPLQRLSLNNTNVGDDASKYIASCVKLETLELAGTKFTYQPLFRIIDACPRLSSLDLTSCRGVRVCDRRRFFEVWEEEKNDD